MSMSLIAFQFISVVIIIAMIYFSVKNAKRKFVNVKITHWLLIIYVGALLLSLIAAPFIINQTTINQERYSREEILREYGEFNAAINNGEIEQLKEKNLLKISSYPYDQPSLEIITNGIGSTSIYVERKKIDDGMIEAYAFQSGMYINGIDFSGKMVPPRFNLYLDKFEVNIPHENISIAINKNEFPITQFLGGGVMYESLDSGQFVIYLQIPQSLKVFSNTGMELHFIED